MKLLCLLACVTLMIPVSAAQAGQISNASSSREQVSMGSGWKFALGELTGAEQPGFDEAAWRTLSVPHDWSI